MSRGSGIHYPQLGLAKVCTKALRRGIGVFRHQKCHDFFIGSVNCEIPATSTLFRLFIPAEPQDYVQKLYAVLRFLYGDECYGLIILDTV